MWITSGSSRQQAQPQHSSIVIPEVEQKQTFVCVVFVREPRGLLDGHYLHHPHRGDELGRQSAGDRTRYLAVGDHCERGAMGQRSIINTSLAEGQLLALGKWTAFQPACSPPRMYHQSTNMWYKRCSVSIRCSGTCGGGISHLHTLSDTSTCTARMINVYHARSSGGGSYKVEE